MKYLPYIQNAALILCVLCGLVVLFIVGDTDAAAEVVSPPITITFALLAGLGGVVGGVIHMIRHAAARQEKAEQIQEKRSDGAKSA